MKLSALQRLAKYARENPAFVKRLREDRKAALREAAKIGIKLSPKETKLLNTVLSGDRLVVSPEQFDMLSKLNVPVARAKAPGQGFWPIRCFVLVMWKPYARRKFSKDRGSAPKKLKA
jgi:hypothetical protein